MKHRSPLKRRTRLQSKTALRPKVELRARTTIQRRTPINKISAKRRSDNGVRARVVSAMRLACSGACARCGRRDMPVHGHERLARSQGGDILTPDCLLCNDCNGWCEDRPIVAAWTGWKVSSKWPHDHTLTSTQARALDGAIVEFTVPDEAVA